MNIKNTKFKGLKIINGKAFLDNRGFFREIFKKNILKRHKPIFWCLSKSKKNVLRGIHIQTKNSQEKFVTVLKGKIIDVVVDLRKNSKTFGEYFSIKISNDNGISLFIPPGFAHGFLALKKENILSYHCTNYRSKKHEVGIKWDDPDIKIKWQIKKPILSSKDKKNLSFKEFLKKYA